MKFTLYLNKNQIILQLYCVYDSCYKLLVQIMFVVVYDAI